MPTLAKTGMLDLEATSSQYASIAHASQTGLSITGEFSIMAWILPESFPANNNRVSLVSKYDVTGGGYEFNIFRTSGATLQLELVVRQNGSTQDVEVVNFSSSGLVSTAKMHHVAVTVAFGPSLSANFYVDGRDRVGAQTGSTTAVGTNTSAFTIGARSGGSNFYDGIISDVHVFNEALSADEVVAMMRHYRTLDSTVGFWKLNADYFDSGPSSNNLTASGSPTFTTASLPFSYYGRTTRVNVGAGDGYVENSDSTWDVTHDAVTGDAVDDTGVSLLVRTRRPSFGTGARIIDRAALPVLTSGLDDDLIVLDAALWFEVSGQAQSLSSPICVVQTTQADPTNLALADYDQFGSTNDPSEGATRVNPPTTNGSMWMPLNSTGLAWVSLTDYTKLGLRMGLDADDTNYGGSSVQEDSATIHASEASSAVTRPFLDVIDDDEFYGGGTAEGGGTGGDAGGVDLGGGSGAGAGEYDPGDSGGGSGGPSSPAAAFFGILLET